MNQNKQEKPEEYLETAEINITSVKEIEQLKIYTAEEIKKMPNEQKEFLIQDLHNTYQNKKIKKERKTKMLVASILVLTFFGILLFLLIFFGIFILFVD